MKKLKVLELFSGTQSISKEFREKGHKTLTVDFNPIFAEPGNEYGIVTDLNIDVNDLTAEMVIEHLGGIPDVVWMSPDCTTYSVAAIYHHREKTESGLLLPTTEKAKQADDTNRYVLNLVKQLNPKVFFIENPRGAMRKMDFVQYFPRHTITYCQYGDQRMKPTDIWTNHPVPNFKAPCKNGDKCHTAAPRGSSTGTQGLKNAIERSRIPQEFCKDLVVACENLCLGKLFQFYHTEIDDKCIDMWYSEYRKAVVVTYDEKRLLEVPVLVNELTPEGVLDDVDIEYLVGLSEEKLESVR